MNEADLFRGYGMRPDQPIPETTKCATPKCRGETLFPKVSIFCAECDLRMQQRVKKPDG